MTAAGPEKGSRQIVHMLFWPALLAIVLLSIAFTLQWFLSLELDAGFWELLSYHWLLGAVAAQTLVTILVILVWKKNLQLHGVSVSLRQAVTMIGINSIGKYSPGKVLGIVARGAALYRVHADSRVAVQTALAEQVAMLHSGAAVTLVAWLFDSGRPGAAIVALVAVMISVLIVSRSGESLVTLAARLSRRYALPPGTGQAFENSYKVVFMVMLLVWVLSALTLYCCVLTFDQRPVPDLQWLLWVLTLGYLGGFAAFLLPAGLGAREGVMLAFLSSQMDTSVAAYVVVMHRLITLSIDLVLGAIALMSGKHLAVPK